ncbi:uncharacterized protein TRAVEDRAFT_71243 [Trametes versicolor FP-101664 SS1]|uniref:uncharacterized protein n=1 Tax=Trametes versicolor (strain FP-101664) TaxID=717944 RepID=UPI0004622494|nr:uncharacterized protein TRAVEDRAFT_71243 [Trametes versicolor FP-101664 SS1]EIW61103.1 hypothetical protein TRAVEDRAFT_71243 [Trametes versicolor FP-101664 SS1]
MSESNAPGSTSGSACTCGECFEGWLSPRMRERLEYSTELRYGLAKALLDTQDGVPDDVTSTLPIDYAQIDVAFYYLPSELRAKISTSPPETQSDADASSNTGDAIYRGYTAAFKVALELATSSSGENGKARCFPTVSDLTKRFSELRAASADTASDSELDATAREHLAAFLDAGGSAEYALDCIVDRAREELSPLGRLYDTEKEYIDAVLDGSDGEPRGACANDLDFARVREKLGLPAETRGVDVPLDDGDHLDPLSDEE